MDKKDLENLSVSELLILKESITDEIENKRARQSLTKANKKALGYVWILVAMAITIFRYYN